MAIVSHQWSGNVIYDTSPDNLAFSDLTTERGRKAINAGAKFAAEAIEAGLIPENQEVYVHTHGGELYFGGRMSETDLKHNQDLIIQSLLNASERHSRIRIGLENLPLFPNSDDPDLIHKPEKVGRTVFEELSDYRRAVEDTPIRLTFDTAHYAYDAPIGAKVDIVSAVDVFGDYLRHLHISDARGFWEPGKSVARDGYIPGEGKIGIEEFKRFFTHIKENYDLTKVTLEAEVQDEDYSNPINREETLKRMVNWLS
jgi:sugar phosphate isomerase/epimerase